MRFQTLGDKAEFTTTHVRNAETSTTIPIGTPVCLQLNGTEDGLAVILPASASQTQADCFFFGVVTDANGILAGHIGQVQQYGYCRNALVRMRTRAASTDNWGASAQSQATGVLLAVDTVYNCFVSTAASVAFASTDAGTITYTRIPYAFLASSIVSVASTVSSGGSNLALTVLTKVFLRTM